MRGAPSVRLEGTPADLTQLVGNWSGEPSVTHHWNAVDRRVPAAGWRRACLRRRADDRARAGHACEHATWAGIVRSLGATQSLAIRFVRARDGGVIGELDPYWDLDRECEARTVFHGTIRGNVIQGTYETTFRGTYPRSAGKWRMVKAESVIK